MNRNLITALLLLIPYVLQAQWPPYYRVKTIQKNIFRNNTWQPDDSVHFFYDFGRSGMIYQDMARSISENGPELFFTASDRTNTLNYDSVYIAYDLQVSPVKEISVSQSLAGIEAKVLKRNRYTAIQPAPLQLNTISEFSYTNGLEIKVTSPTSSEETKYIYSYNKGSIDSIYVYVKNSSGQTSLSQLTVYEVNNGSLACISLYNISNSLNYNSKTYFNYDINGRLKSNIVMMNSNTNPTYDTVEATYYSYDAKGYVLVAYKGDTLAPSLKTEYTYHSIIHKIATEVYSGDYYHNNSFDTFAKRTYVYDNSGLLTEVNLKRWFNNSWIDASDTSTVYSSNIVTFEYEPYWTSIPEITQNEPTVKLYPSPSSDFIRVEAVWKEEKAFEAMICDMHGRVIRQWQEPANRFYTRTIPIPELPAGVYIIRMQCGDEAFSKQFVKQ